MLEFDRRGVIIASHEDLNASHSPLETLESNPLILFYMEIQEMISTRDGEVANVSQQAFDIFTLGSKPPP
jgi:hypothetical protein